MRKLVLWITLLSLMLGIMSPAMVNAENDYKGLTFEQLQAEYLIILQAMWKTKKWQEVEVPAGIYQVGVEIPAGEWTIKAVNLFGVAVYLGTKLDVTKTGIEWDSSLGSEYVDTESYPNGWTVNLVDDMFIHINEIVIFTPPVKGQGFTFK